MSQPEPRLYGRRKGRPLRVRKSALVQTLLPQVAISLSMERPVDPCTLFTSRPSTCWLEIGFGGGEHLAAQAARHPHIGMLGCEPFLNGIAGLLDQIDRAQVDNVRIFPSDARLFVQNLLPQSLARTYVLFADPWPKKRHASRRFIQSETLGLLAQAMAIDAELLLATDDPVLQEWTTAF